MTLVASRRNHPTQLDNHLLPHVTRWHLAHRWWLVLCEMRRQEGLIEMDGSRSTTAARFLPVARSDPVTAVWRKP